jgi:hypothetical protein
MMHQQKRDVKNTKKRRPLAQRRLWLKIILVVQDGKVTLNRKMRVCLNEKAFLPFLISGQPLSRTVR